MKHTLIYTGSLLILLILVLNLSCKKKDDTKPPTVELIKADNLVKDGSIIAVGDAIHFGINAHGTDANITNLCIKKTSNNIQKTVLDSGMNSSGFSLFRTFFQGGEEEALWTISVMDKNRSSSSVSLKILKDPNSMYRAINYFPSVKLGYPGNNIVSHFFSPAEGRMIDNDSTAFFEESIDLLAYFKYSEQNGQMAPSPTLSSPGEEGGGVLEYYPEIAGWQEKNYTLYDIRATNGVTTQAFAQAHHDSLLIASYDAAWGKRKYKWATDNLFIPFLTANGKKGIIHVLHADLEENGSLECEIKIQQ